MENENWVNGYRAHGENAKENGYESIFVLNKKYVDLYSRSTKEQMKAYYSPFDIEYLKSERILWAALNNDTLCQAIDELIEEKAEPSNTEGMQPFLMEAIAQKAFDKNLLLTVQTRALTIGGPDPIYMPARLLKGRVQQVSDRFIVVVTPPVEIGYPPQDNILFFEWVEYVEVSEN